MIQVVDIFAGPGGLGEGFASFRDRHGRRPFQVTVSIEKDEVAYSTLRLRAFFRKFDRPPKAYDEYLLGRMDWHELKKNHPREAAVAEREALCAELGPKQARDIRDLIHERIDGNKPVVLLGGPPCQAYSLVGRARRRGIPGYSAEADARQTLYIEYLQVLADHAPDAFVMENVKGLLSARLAESRLFGLIENDLRAPGKALARSGRRAAQPGVEYDLFALGATALGEKPSPRDFIVRCEEHGVPQRRHRVIIVGIRRGVQSNRFRALRRVTAVTVEEALRGLPALRSGVTGRKDSESAWLDELRRTLHHRWIRRLDPAVHTEMQTAVEQAGELNLDRGLNVSRQGRQTILNHSSRGHMPTDLGRYLFASSYAKVTGASPRLADFPTQLLPDHDNVRKGVDDGLFADRFRVQLAHGAATTVTSHISKDGHYFIHPDPAQCRSLTVREAATLQTFPKDYFFAGPRTSQYHQVGNAVPPKLAGQIAAILADVLS